ncbi:MAG: hypothetical protein ACOCZ6_05435 [Nanoarchaeota archaeon]
MPMEDEFRYYLVVAYTPTAREPIDRKKLSPESPLVKATHTEFFSKLQYKGLIDEKGHKIKNFQERVGQYYEPLSGLYGLIIAAYETPGKTLQ